MKTILILSIFLLISCSNESPKETQVTISTKEKIITAYSESENEYVNFNSRDAINRIARIENEYFKDIKDGVSQYYGTVWRQNAENRILQNGVSQYTDYLNNLNPNIDKPDSLHCTLYAYEGLVAGLQFEQLKELKKLHTKRWKSREVAGWSIGYLLVKYFNWKAYLILDANSVEYKHCMKSYRKDKTYPVWKQPNIPLVNVFIKGTQDSLIHELLSQHEFGWGFSEQGIHTWITRYTELKECNWLGAPALKYQDTEFEKPLFLSTEFNQYVDYRSHVIIFPEKDVKEY